MLICSLTVEVVLDNDQPTTSSIRVNIKPVKNDGACELKSKSGRLYTPTSTYSLLISDYTYVTLKLTHENHI